MRCSTCPDGYKFLILYTKGCLFQGEAAFCGFMTYGGVSHEVNDVAVYRCDAGVFMRALPVRDTASIPLS